MRLPRIGAAVLVLSVSAPAFAEDWIEYILKSTVPRASAPPLAFQLSLSILDENGKRIRYELDADGNRTTRVP